MNWQPRDILNLVALLGSFVLFLVGAFMVWQGVAAEGSIDIKSSLISGSLKTGSAGLFIVFLSFFLAALALFSINSSPKHHKASAPEQKARGSHLAQGFFALVGACSVSTALAAFGLGQPFGLLAGLLGFFALFAGLAYLMEQE